MEELLYQYNPWWEAKFNYEGIIERPEYTVRLQRHFDAKMVVFLTGLRRVGKTTLMKLLIGSLIKRGIEGKYIL
jgi:predicted AAA+ superfamily ATPase